MKKVIVSALGLMLGGTLLVTGVQAEVEHQFGGYWRTRLDVMDNGKGYDGETRYTIDTRTRLYYTAKFSDNLKLVNKFEVNATWGDSGYGDIGADGMGVWRIKNTYVDANFGVVNTKIGAHAIVLNKGLLFDDDFAGVTVAANLGAVTPEFVWMHASDKDFGRQEFDNDIIAGRVIIKAGDMVTITPTVTAQVQSAETVTDDDGNITPVGDSSLVWVGVDVDAKFDPVSVSGTFIYQTGDTMGVDSNAFAGYLGVDAGIVHGAFFYASGDDGTDPTETTNFTPISPYVVTCEIMGIGMLDGYQGPGGNGFGFTNEMFLNVGTSFKPMDNLTLSIDGWYGLAAEENEFGNDEKGFEIDTKAAFKLVDNLKAEIFFAYLVAGEFTNDAAGNTDDVFEGGMRLSLSF
jgi:hypothetical protein